MRNNYVRNSLISILVLFSLMVSLFVPAYAELNFNVQDYTDEELLEIMTIIQQSDTKLGYLYSSDVLEVGKDIPAGHYEFWVEEEDIGFSQEYLGNADQYDYHCGFSTLCYILWGNEYDGSEHNYEEIYYDEYNVHKMITLEEGQFVWTKVSSAGANYKGLRMKYLPNTASGLF